MQISELARRAGVTVHALRHYERLGLITPARRPSGYRDYPESMRREVVFIAMSRAIGFALKDVATRLPAYRAGRLGFDDMVQAMHERVHAIDTQVAALQAQRAQVVDHIAWLKAQKKKQQQKQRRSTARPWPATPPRPHTTPPARSHP
ncbi:MAG: MerR family DNA-binding transcriptional regulator [Ramlibacter sp.]|nr:MerR family DNA-binding transcriptional regulator [Ramlibacter sp.]